MEGYISSEGDSEESEQHKSEHLFSRNKEKQERDNENNKIVSPLSGRACSYREDISERKRQKKHPRMPCDYGFKSLMSHKRE